MIQKGLKEPGDKLQLIRVLSLAEVLTRLEENTRGNEEDVPFREGLGKLANGLGSETMKLVDEVKFDPPPVTSATDLLWVRLRYPQIFVLLPRKKSRNCSQLFSVSSGMNGMIRPSPCISSFRHY
jgi:exportin-T